MDESQILATQMERLGLAVASADRERLLLLLDELLRWNRTHNLTAITSRDEAIEKHVVDSLTLLPLLDGEERLLDLGSGGGFPCLPLKIALASLRVISVDAVAKKIAFQRHVARRLALSGFEPLHERAEDLPRRSGFAGGFNVVVSRAFAALDVFARLALPCLAAEGRIIAMKGSEGKAEFAQAQPALTRMGIYCSEMHPLVLPASGAVRTLIVLRRSQK